MTVQGHLPGRAIEINVDVIQTVDAATVPVSRADAPRTERRREREWDRARERVREVKVNNREAARRVMESRRAALVAAARPGADASSPPNAAAGSTSSYVTPITSTTAHAARADSTMTRDITVQPSSASAVGVAATQIRPRATLLPSTVPDSLQWAQHQHQGD